MLASDWQKETAKAYGVWKEKSMYGRKYFGIERTTFILDEDGVVRYIFPKVKVDGHVQRTFESAVTMPVVYITRRECFCASHILGSEHYSRERNLEVFGSCAALHGHNYEMEVTLAGEVQEETGYVVDLKIIKELIRSEIIRKVDHRHLNTDVDFLKESTRQPRIWRGHSGIFETEDSFRSIVLHPFA